MKRLMLLLLVAASCGKEDKVETARSGCRARYDAIQNFMRASGRLPGSDEELKKAARRTEKDPWGRDYEIELETGGKVVVWSRGPDGVQGTKDDVIYPPDE